MDVVGSVWFEASNYHGWFSVKLHTGHPQLVSATLSEKRREKRLFVISFAVSRAQNCSQQHEEALCASHQLLAL